MLPSRRCWTSAALLAVALAAPVRAGELDRYLPPDTEVVVNLNVRQALDSPLVKKHALARLRDALKDMSQVDEILGDLGFDPFKDLDRVIVAGPGGRDTDRGLVIVHGRFDLKKFKGRGEQAARDNPDALKIVKVPDGLGGSFLVYEVATNQGGQESALFVALPDKTTVLASPGKDYVVEAFKRAAGKVAPALKNKAFQAVLEKVDDGQSLSLAAVGSALGKGGAGQGAIKDFLDKLDALSGGLTVSDGVKLKVVLSAQSPEAARQLREGVDKGLKQLITFAALAASAQKELAPLFEVIRSIRAGGKGKLVTLEAAVSAEVIEEAFPKDG